MRDVSHKSQKTRIALLLEYVDEWRNRNDWSRETVCEQIVQAHYKIGNDKLTQVKFEQAGDIITRQKNNADRIYRWLDDKSKDRNLLTPNFEQSILAALPEDLLRAYMNEILAPLGLMVQGIHEGSDTLNVVAHLVDISKETAEATGAVAELVTHPTKENLLRADREIGDAIEALAETREDIRGQMND